MAKKTSQLPITDERLLKVSRRKLLFYGSVVAFMSFYYRVGAFAQKLTGSALNAKPNAQFLAGDGLEVSSEDLFTSYNNFYEYSFDKGQVKDLAQEMPIEPWSLDVGGLVEKPVKLSIEDLLDLAELESRVYRLRCVETWAAVVPWVGYPLRHLIRHVKPKPEAKYIRFQSYFDADMPNISSTAYYPWPYSEGLRLDEAENDMTLLTFGAYGKPLLKQNGAPVRVVVPWKYGFKSAKSITKIEFVAKEPKTMWNELAPTEYGFYANVNPAVGHPRWSQAYEKPIGNWVKKEKTLFLNGYESQVGDLYADMDLERFF